MKQGRSDQLVVRGKYELEQLDRMDVSEVAELEIIDAITDVDFVFNFASLEQLRILNAEVNLNNLAKLLRNAPNLQDLIFTGCTFDEPSAMLKLSLPQLSKLNLSRSELSMNIIATLLCCSSKLEELSITNCRQLQIDLNNEFAFKPTNLQTLKICDTNFTGDNVAIILRNTPNITTLNLWRISINVREAVLSGEFSLAYLQKLTLHSSNISMDDLAKLAQKSPLLRHLIVDGCFGLNTALSPGLKIVYSKLERLNMYQSDITIDNLVEIWCKSPKLYTIHLDQCMNLGALLSAGIEFVSTELEILHVCNSAMTADTLAKILSKTPNLKELYLYDSIDLSNDFNTEYKIELPKLKELNISCINLTKENLLVILGKAQMLRKMRAPSDCLNLALKENLDFELPALEDLECNVERDNLPKFLLKAPNIKWSAQEFLEKLRRPGPWILNATQAEMYDMEQLNNIIALHLFTKHNLTEREQISLLKNIDSPLMRLLLVTKYKNAIREVLPLPAILPPMTATELFYSYARSKASQIYQKLFGAEELTTLLQPTANKDLALMLTIPNEINAGILVEDSRIPANIFEKFTGRKISALWSDIARLLVYEHAVMVYGYIKQILKKESAASHGSIPPAIAKVLEFNGDDNKKFFDEIFIPLYREFVREGVKLGGVSKELLISNVKNMDWSKITSLETFFMAALNVESLKAKSTNSRPKNTR